MTLHNPLAARAMNEALLTCANIDRLHTVLADFASGLRKQAQQEGTAKTSGLLARFEAEYEALILIEEIFKIDTSDDREAIADECLKECGFDLRTNEYHSTAETLADYADHMNDRIREDRMVAEWEAFQ